MPDLSRTDQLRCRDCGDHRVVPVANHAAPCRLAGDVSGFVIERVEVTFRGRCPACVGERDRGRARVAS